MGPLFKIDVEQKKTGTKFFSLNVIEHNFLNDWLSKVNSAIIKLHPTAKGSHVLYSTFSGVDAIYFYFTVN